MRITVRLSTAYSDDRPGEARGQRGHRQRAEEQPGHHRGESAGLLDVVDLLLAAPAGAGPEGDATDEGGDEAVRADRDGHEVGRAAPGPGARDR